MIKKIVSDIKRLYFFAHFFESVLSLLIVYINQSRDFGGLIIFYFDICCLNFESSPPLAFTENLIFV